MGKVTKQKPKAKHVIFRAWRRGPHGEKLWARDYGLKAWPIYI